MKQVRNSIFETNSSATHAFSVIFGDYTSITLYSEEEQDDVYLDNDEVKDLLSCLPTEMLESELLSRSKQ